MLLVDNTVYKSRLKEALYLFIAQEKAIKGYKIKICEIHKAPILTGKDFGDLRNPLPNKREVISKNLPTGYELRTIYGFLYEIVKK